MAWVAVTTNCNFDLKLNRHATAVPILGDPLGRVVGLVHYSADPKIDYFRARGSYYTWANHAPDSRTRILEITGDRDAKKIHAIYLIKLGLPIGTDWDQPEGHVDFVRWRKAGRGQGREFALDLAITRNQFVCVPVQYNPSADCLA